jgi:plastocyanin
VDGEAKPLTIQAGDTVVRENKDRVTPSAISADGGRTFDTGLIPPGGKSQPVTFPRAKTVKYVCAPHPRMRGTSVVEAAGR